MENWKDIAGFEGFYQVSDKGRIQSLDREIHNSWNGWTFIKGKISKQFLNQNGYPYVNLCKEGKVKQETVHRLVAQAFIPNPENKPYINHIDANIINAEAINLEWSTPSENTQHMLKLGRGGRRGGKHAPHSKLTEEQVIEIRKFHKEGVTQYRLAKNYKITNQAVNNILTFKSWKMEEKKEEIIHPTPVTYTEEEVKKLIRTAIMDSKLIKGWKKEYEEKLTYWWNEHKKK